MKKTYQQPTLTVHPITMCTPVAMSMEDTGTGVISNFKGGIDEEDWISDEWGDIL